MHPRLRGIPVHPPTIWIPRQSIHDGPTDRARLGYLQPQIVVRPRDRVVVLVDDEVVAVRVLVAEVEVHPV